MLSGKHCIPSTCVPGPQVTPEAASGKQTLPYCFVPGPQLMSIVHFPSLVRCVPVPHDVATPPLREQPPKSTMQQSRTAIRM
jgi:hypothetical protein